MPICEAFSLSKSVQPAIEQNDIIGIQKAGDDMRGG
jgi:hypothetical protein